MEQAGAVGVAEDAQEWPTEADLTEQAAKHAGMKPLYDRILVKRQDERETALPGGKVITPDVAREKPLIGTVLAVGDGRLLQSGTVLPLKVKPGDTILYGRFAGVELPDEMGAGLLVMGEDEVLAVRV